MFHLELRKEKKGERSFPKGCHALREKREKIFRWDLVFATLSVGETG
jgi:hypothetical protein